MSSRERGRSPGCLAWAGLPPGQPVIVDCRWRKTLMLMSYAGPWLGEQILQAFLVVVVVGELEDRLLELAGEPDHGLANQLLVPLDAARAARAMRWRVSASAAASSSTTCALGCSCKKLAAIDRRDLAFDGLGDDRRLVLAERQHDDLPRVENRADAHRDRPPRHVLLAEEVAGRVDRASRGRA